jgi:DNA-binding IclR family transcriptional regulator
MSPSTLRTRSALEAELAEICEQGYALNLGKTDEEVGAIAAVVRGPSDSSVCALAIAAPLSRTSRDKLISMAVPLLTAYTQAGRASADIDG